MRKTKLGLQGSRNSGSSRHLRGERGPGPMVGWDSRCKRSGFFSGGIRDQQRTQRRTAAGEPRFDRTYINVEDFGDLFIGKTLDLAQDDDSAEGIGNLPERLFDAVAKFGLRGVVEWRASGVC